METVALALGGNLGDVPAEFLSAIQKMLCDLHFGGGIRTTSNSDIRYSEKRMRQRWDITEIGLIGFDLTSMAD